MFARELTLGAGISDYRDPPKKTFLTQGCRGAEKVKKLSFLRLETQNLMLVFLSVSALKQKMSACG